MKRISLAMVMLCLGFLALASEAPRVSRSSPPRFNVRVSPVTGLSAAIAEPTRCIVGDVATVRHANRLTSIGTAAINTVSATIARRENRHAPYLIPPNLYSMDLRKFATIHDTRARPTYTRRT